MHSASAAKWEIEPAVYFTETYTDNLRLSSPGSEQQEWVSTISPRVRIRGLSDRLLVDIDYKPEFMFWAREGDSQFLQLYDASATAEFVKRTLFLDARAVEKRESVTLFGPLTDNNANIVENRTSVRIKAISPYLRHDFGTAASGEARLTYSTVNADAQGSVFDSKSKAVDLRLSSGPAFRLRSWTLGYGRERIDYDNSLLPEVETQKAFATFKQLITRHAAVIAEGGYEDNTFLATGAAPRGPFWSAGAEWDPGTRTHLSAAVGRRFFGPTRAFDFRHRTRLTVWRANYTEDISTTRSQFLFPATLQTAAFLDSLFQSLISDAAARRDAVNAFIVQNGLSAQLSGPINYFTASPFLIKRLEGSVALEGVRNTVLASLYAETREELGKIQSGIADLIASDRTRQRGGNVQWSLRISPRTTSIVNVGAARNEFLDTGREDRFRIVRLSLARQLSPRITGSLNLRRVQNTSTQSDSSYTENAVSVTVIAKF
ncbi:MAG: TIGR03016 family PEP-CTERM system-associated outer membrane protein [Betaproteobacteria bacterium]